MKQPIWTQRYEVNTILLNHLKRLGLVGLLQVLQDVAWIHASHLGHGYEEMIRRNMIWVLMRQRVAMTAWPVWGETITLRTWVRPITGPMALRDYEILVGDQRVGEATASWLTLDPRSRRPVKLNLGEHQLECRRDGTLDTEPERIAAWSGLEALATIRVRNSDLDLNGHVNNVRYAQWILDALPLATHAAHRLDSYEVNFLAESHLGDEVVIERAALEPVAGSPRRLQFQGRRTGDDKVLFVARLGASPAPSEAAGTPPAPERP